MTLLKKTTGRCPVCARTCSATVQQEMGERGKVWMVRTCPDHGETRTCLATDGRFYWVAKGERPPCCAGSCEPAPQFQLGKNFYRTPREPFETLSTCLALIEIVRSCNLSCPTCYADSPHGPVDAVPMKELQQRIEGVISRKGKLEILQLSGGEPTLHPEFFALAEWLQKHPRIDYLLLNTNGLKLGQDRDFQRLASATLHPKKWQVYLQYDGPQLEGQVALRGVDLREMRERAIAFCGEMGVPVTLAMTVLPETISHAWEAVAFGLAHPQIHGITFQPAFSSGRTSGRQQNGERINTADIILALLEQSAGTLTEKDFTPLPCGDPNCAVIGYLLRLDGAIRKVSDFIDFSHLQNFLKDRVQYNLEDLAECGCEVEPLGAILKQLELKSSMAFRLFIKPFMDAATWDQDRIDRCCTHVIRPDGKLDSFCRYYGGFADARRAP